MIVADTNVVSELMKGEPSPAVRAWVLAHGHHELRITAITVAEILYGVERLPNGRRKDTLREAAVHVFSRFTEDVLPFDAAAATLRKMQFIASDLLMQAQREAAAILLQASMTVIDARHVPGGSAD